MFVQVLRTTWTASRVIVLVLAVVALGVPLATVIYGADLSRESSYTVANWLQAAASVGNAIPVVALVTGVLLGMTTWSADHAGAHVYALSLPVARWRYVLLRFGAGAVLVLPICAALTGGALIASGAVDLPDGIRSYPLALAGRFTLACLVSYAIFFALSSATRRIALALVGSLGGLVVGDLLLGSLGSSPVIIPSIFYLLTTWPGPLAILLGRWALFDV